MDYASSRLACAVVDDVHVAVHGHENPDEDDWEEYLRVAREILKNHETPRVLVYTLGGNPTTTQRGVLNDINKGLLPRVSVMVDSRMARGAVTALSWFNPSIKAFSLENIEGALAHLELTGARATEVHETLERLKGALEAARAS